MPREPEKKQITSYAHKDALRTNNPLVGLVTPGTDPDEGKATSYAYDPHIDPHMEWAGKAERMSFAVPLQSLHVHERIDPRSIIEAVCRRGGRQGRQMGLFEEEREVPLRQAIEFYRHSRNWSNRLIAGDSLLIMNSLLGKENMAAKVQCVYMDPPYGITYGSNFQPFTNKREVMDGKSEDLTAEPEMIKAFRDTWELGIHSYLSYMRDRLLLIRELLTESGSVFVQIGAENVHRVSLIMDEIFGAENRVATITFMTSGASSSNTLPSVADYLLWYAKDRKNMKYRQLHDPLNRSETVEFFTSYAAVELPDGTCRKLTTDERSDPNTLPHGARLYQRMPLTSQGLSSTGRSDPYEWNEKIFPCAPRHWSVSMDGLDRLAEINRLDAAESDGATLGWKRYENETPGRKINNVWARQMSVAGSAKRYVVQTADSVLERCLLMASDPGDLVFDPTCGSGVTAYTAEKWGRRWITCDTSRVATAIARQRLMTALFPYYKLAYPQDGVGGGFEYKKVPYVSAKTLAYNEVQTFTTLYNQPLKDSARSRVTGPFTVEAVPSPTVQPIHELSPPPEPLPENESIVRAGETLRQNEWIDELLENGIRGKNNQHISFSRITPLPNRWLHAIAETSPDNSARASAAASRPKSAPESAAELLRAAFSFGPEHAPLEPRQVENALQEAGKLVPSPKIVIFAAFQFDPEASKDIAETNWPGVTLLTVGMNADLQTDDLKKKQTGSDSFWLIGQPDIQVEQIRAGDHVGRWFVKVEGFDYFNTRTSELTSGNAENIAIWMLDTDYDGRSVYPRQVFFPMAGKNDGWQKLAKNLRAEIDTGLMEAYRGTTSLPFESGKNKRIAVKIVDDRGIESLRVMNL